MIQNESQHYQASKNLISRSRIQCQEKRQQYFYKNVASFKIQFTQWIRSLPMEERFLAVKIPAAGLPHLIRNFIRKIDSDKQREVLDNKKISKKYQKNFFDSVVFVSDGNHYFDHICFDFNYLEYPEKLYDLLMSTLQGGQNAQPIAEMQKMKRSIQEIKQQIQNANSQEEMIWMILSFLRHQILSKYIGYLKENNIGGALEDEKKRKKQFSIYWKNLSEQYRKKILLLGKCDIKDLQLYLQDQSISIKTSQLERQVGELLRLEKNQFCNKIFKCKIKKSCQMIVSYYELVYKYWKNEIEKYKKKKYYKNINGNIKTEGRVEYQSKYKSNYVAKNNDKLAQSRTENNYQEIQKYQNIKTEAKEQRYAKKNKSRKIRKSISAESNETNQTQYEKVLETSEKKNKFQKIEETEVQKEKNKFKEFERQKEKQVEKVVQKIEKTKKYKANEREKIQKNTKILNFKKIQKIDQKFKNDKIDKIFGEKTKRQSICNSSSVKIFSKEKTTIFQTPQKSIQTPSPILSKSQISALNLMKLNEELIDFSDQISEQANGYHQRRVVAYERIQFLLNYYSIPIKLFGSCASGIAIKNSDIDIAIDNCIISYMEYLPQNEKIKLALEKLEQLFKTQSWISNIRLIKTAAVPLIKMKMDTSIQFLDPSYDAVFENLNRNHSCGSLEADITIQTRNKSEQCNHLGIISTNAINQWLSDIKPLRAIVILMKELFSAKRLNITYEGGLNTFSMIVLIVAYIIHAKLENEENVGMVLEKILKFYAIEFDETKYGINLDNHQKGNIYYEKTDKKDDLQSSNKNKADLQIRDPMNNSKNMTRNCYSFPLIKKLFLEIYQKCYSNSEAQLSEFIKNQIRSSEIIESIEKDLPKIGEFNHELKLEKIRCEILKRYRQFNNKQNNKFIEIYSTFVKE